MNSMLQLILPLVLYVCVFISGFIISISLGITKRNLGQCPLYMDINDQVSTTTHYFNGGSDSTCNFVVYLAVITGVVYGFAMILLYLYVFYRVFSGNEDATQLIKKFIELLVNATIWVLQFIAACIMSVGRSTMCSNVFRVQPKADSCSVLDTYKGDSINAANAVERIILAEVTIWVSMIWLTLLIIPGVITIWRERKSAPSSDVGGKH